MDATMLTVVGTGIALFLALWKVEGARLAALDRRMLERFEAVDQRFEMAETANRERFEMAEKLNRERFEMAEKLNRERFEAMDQRWTERFEMAEKHNDAAHAAICESIRKLDDRSHADAAALHNRLDALNGRFDDLYRRPAGAPPPDPAGPAPDAE